MTSGRWVWLLHWNMPHYVKGDRAVCGRFPRRVDGIKAAITHRPSGRVCRSCDRIAAQEGA